jgi:hypothetical protein
MRRHTIALVSLALGLVVATHGAIVITTPTSVKESVQQTSVSITGSEDYYYIGVEGIDSDPSAATIASANTTGTLTCTFFRAMLAYTLITRSFHRRAAD